MLYGDYFRFENDNSDFPVYKKNPHIPKSGWIVLLIAMIAGFIAQAIPENEILGGFLFFIVIFIPLMYYLKWDVKAIFQKPKARDVALAVLLFAGYIIYAMIMSEILDFFSLTGTATVDESVITLYSVVSLIFSMMGEEFIKLIPFLFFLRLTYKYSNSRKLSVILSVFIVIVFFGLLHAMDLKSLVSVLLLQGLGSLFEFYGYVKTKNLLISYISHLCTDAFIFALILLGVS